jgi:hypothetical protein
MTFRQGQGQGQGQRQEGYEVWGIKGSSHENVPVHEECCRTKPWPRSPTQRYWYLVLSALTPHALSLEEISSPKYQVFLEGMANISCLTYLPGFVRRGEARLLWPVRTYA